MPDITMCMNPIGCPNEKQCWRYMATPDPYQSMCDFSSIDPEKTSSGKCEYFILARGE